MANENKEITDKQRLDFLESLLKRALYNKKKTPAYYKPSDIHITGPERCSIYVRGLERYVEYSGHGTSVREAIDNAIKAASEGQKG